MSREEREAPRPLLPRCLGRPDGAAAGRAAAGRGVPRHDGLQHAGRAAGTLWRRDPRPSVSSTTLLTAMWAAGALWAFALAASGCATGATPTAWPPRAAGGHRAFSTVIFAAPCNRRALLSPARLLIGLGGGLFAVATLTAAMTMPAQGSRAAGWRWAPGAPRRPPPRGCHRTGRRAARRGSTPSHDRALGRGLVTPATGYSFVYHLEIGLLFVTLVVLGPLVRARGPAALKTGSGPYRPGRLPDLTRQLERTPMVNAFFGNFDLASLSIWLFWIFFAGLVYLHPAREHARGLPAGRR
jgi:BCD family chlorophyll transporter-like MFS transporter